MSAANRSCIILEGADNRCCCVLCSPHHVEGVTIVSVREMCGRGGE